MVDSTTRAEARGGAQAGPPGLAARQVAASLLQKVVLGGTPLDPLVDEAGGVPAYRALAPKDRALVRALLAVALRRRGTLARAILNRLQRPLDAGANALAAHLHVGAAQLLFLDVPDHAAVALAVAAVKADRRIARASGLANGVLRRIARERHDILAERLPPGIDACPWLFARWTATYGEDIAAAIAEVHAAPAPPLDLSARGDPAGLAAALGARLLPTGSLRLAAPGAVSLLPGYEEGAWWVQDAAAALPARLFGDVAGRRVADLCAAPGGKTMQLAAMGARVTAVERAPGRLKRLARNLARTRLQADLVASDVFDFAPDAPFDAVLLDAPCTATGTIRRHPDVQWAKREPEVAAAADLQRRMLQKAADLVAPGGRLVFCTCSLEPEEGEAQVAPFLAARPDFMREPIRAEEVAGLGHLLTPGGFLRTLPCHGFGEGAAGMDGFFAARFRREA